jgi:lysophospholipase L1-like esterase
MSAAAPARGRRRLHPAYKVTLLLLGVGAAALGVELAFRAFWTLPPWFAEFHQAGMYVATADGDVALMPGYRGELVVDAPTTVAINSLGMRAPEVGAKQPDERRVLVLGDSVVWGYGVQAEQTFAALLQQRLGEGGRRVVVGNAGVPGYGSRHMAQQLARLDGPFAPDVIVACGYLGNDAIDDAQPQRTVFAGLQMQGPWARLVAESWRARLMYRSRAALWLEAWLANAHPQSSLLAQLRFDPEEAERAAGFGADRLFAGLFLDVRDPATRTDPAAPPVVPRQLATLRGAVRAMCRTAGERPVVFVVLPTLRQVDRALWRAELVRLGHDPLAFERGLAQQRWTEVAREAGARAFDATPVLEGHTDPAGLFLSDRGHLSARGHEVIAAWLAPEIAPLLAQ